MLRVFKPTAGPRWPATRPSNIYLTGLPLLWGNSEGGLSCEKEHLGIYLPHFSLATLSFGLFRWVERRVHISVPLLLSDGCVTWKRCVLKAPSVGVSAPWRQSAPYAGNDVTSELATRLAYSRSRNWRFIDSPLPVSHCRLWGLLRLLVAVHVPFCETCPGSWF